MILINQLLLVDNFIQLGEIPQAIWPFGMCQNRFPRSALSYFFCPWVLDVLNQGFPQTSPGLILPLFHFVWALCQNRWDELESLSDGNSGCKKIKKKMRVFVQPTGFLCTFTTIWLPPYSYGLQTLIGSDVGRRNVAGTEQGWGKTKWSWQSTSCAAKVETTAPHKTSVESENTLCFVQRGSAKAGQQMLISAAKGNMGKWKVDNRKGMKSLHEKLLKCISVEYFFLPAFQNVKTQTARLKPKTACKLLIKKKSHK